MKPIKLTEELIRQMTEEFTAALGKMKLSDGEVTYKKSFKYTEDKDAPRVRVLFEPEAYAKMLTLLHGFSDEVGWHGIVDRTSDKEFVIKDILVYPQMVTGVTVDTDQEEYQKWMMSLIMNDEDTFNHLHMQGHSHVNMATSPSSTDNEFYNDILSQLSDEDYYIFMIFNKRLERTVKIYDLKNNILYENADIDVGIRSENGCLDAFLAQAKSMVTRVTAGFKSTDKTKELHDGKKAKKSGKTERGTARPYPGLYGDYAYGYGAGYGSESTPDYDDEIFGSGRNYWWNR